METHRGVHFAFSVRMLRTETNRQLAADGCLIGGVLSSPGPGLRATGPWTGPTFPFLWVPRLKYQASPSTSLGVQGRSVALNNLETWSDGQCEREREQSLDAKINWSVLFTSKHLPQVRRGSHFTTDTSASPGDPRGHPQSGQGTEGGSGRLHDLLKVASW